MAIFVYIDGVDRTADVELNSISVQSALSNRGGSADFTIISGAKPSENQEVIIYKGDTIVSHDTGAKTITTSGSYQKGVGFFNAGDILECNIGETSLVSAQTRSSQRAVTVVSNNESGNLITYSDAVSSSFTGGAKVGVRLFAGVIGRVQSRNTGHERNVEYDIEGVSFNKIFDKKYVSDSWDDSTVRKVMIDVLNNDVNYNVSLDQCDYADNAAAAAAWLDSVDGDNPTTELSDYVQGGGAVKFNYTFSTGLASFALFFSSIDFSSIVLPSGPLGNTPTKGYLTFWMKVPASYPNSSSSTVVRLGEEFGKNHSWALKDLIVNDGAWRFYSIPLNTFSAVTSSGGVGTNWSAISMVNFLFYGITTSGSILVDDIRIVGESSFSPELLSDTSAVDSLVSPRIKPSELFTALGDRTDKIFYIDEYRKLRLEGSGASAAPFEVTNSSENFYGMKVEVDQSQLGNRVLLLGGEEYSDNRYPQIELGDNAKREWVIKSKFADMEVLLDDATDSNLALIGTTTTNVTITAHGLVTGDHVTNRTRSNAVREVTVVDANNFTVDAVPSQTVGDTITFFTIPKTVGYEGLDDADEASFDFMANSNARTMRNSSHIVTFASTVLIKFSFIERVPIQVLYTDYGSVAALKALGLGDGIFDLDTISDASIQDRVSAITIAEAKVKTYSNPIVTGSFTTSVQGLKPGQLLTVEDSFQEVLGDYLIQSVSARQSEGEFKDNFIYNVKFGTSLNGWIEFMQKLLRGNRPIQIDDGSIVATFVEANEIVTTDDVNSIADGVGFELASEAETLTSDDVNTVDDTTSGAWQYETSTGQVFTTRFGLCDYGP